MVIVDSAAIADKIAAPRAWTGLRARIWLDELVRGTQPFFLHVSFWKPHSPYEVAAPYDAMYDSVEIPIPDTVSADAAQKLPLPLQKLALRNGGSKLDRERTEWAYRSYYGTITHVDHEIGLLLDALEASGAARLAALRERFEKRLGPRKHFVAVLAVFVGSWLSGYFILVTNAFMQHPVTRMK